MGSWDFDPCTNFCVRNSGNWYGRVTLGVVGRAGLATSIQAGAGGRQPFWAISGVGFLRPLTLHTGQHHPSPPKCVNWASGQISHLCTRSQKPLMLCPPWATSHHRACWGERGPSHGCPGHNATPRGLPFFCPQEKPSLSQCPCAEAAQWP